MQRKITLPSVVCSHLIRFVTRAADVQLLRMYILNGKIRYSLTSELTRVVKLSSDDCTLVYGIHYTLTYAYLTLKCVQTWSNINQETYAIEIREKDVQK